LPKRGGGRRPVNCILGLPEFESSFVSSLLTSQPTCFAAQIFRRPKWRDIEKLLYFVAAENWSKLNTSEKRVGAILRINQ
jgi:hypothetical protein